MMTLHHQIKEDINDFLGSFEDNDLASEVKKNKDELLAEIMESIRELTTAFIA